MSKDYYKILGIEKGASDDEIRRGFRRLAQEHHPDKGGDQAKFKEINEAYQVLSDKTKRAQYDQFGQTFEGMGGAGGYGPFAGGQGFGGFEGFDMGNLNDIFGEMFGSAGGRRRAEVRGRDIEMDMTIDFKEAAFGVAKVLELYKNDTCSRCGGKGAEPGSELVNCAKCGGRGQIRQVQRTILGNFESVATCDECGGRGKIPAKKCSACNGAGVHRVAKKIKVDVPVGIADGETLKMSGEGEAVSHGRTGDLYINISVRPDKRWERDENDVLSGIEINFRDAALGTEVEIETIHGPVILKIPSGTQSGAIFRLRGKGIKSRRGSGDHLVTVTVLVPQKLTKKQKQLLEDWE
ncbi:MAG: molecular chaperone DnaJ [Patescibacteria group bacterium]